MTAPESLATVPPPPDEQATTTVEELAHFRNHPLAQPTLSDSNFTPVFISRSLTHNNRGHTLMASTWKTADTIAHLLSCSRPSRSQKPPSTLHPLDTGEATRAEIRRFYTFGSGLNAHANLLHGGVIAAILDSTVANATVQVTQQLNMFTVQLNVRFEKPVQTPGTVMVRAWVEKVEFLPGERMKVWAAGEVTGGDNGEVVHAKAEGLWLKGGEKKEDRGKM